jgi:toxin YoeB
MAYILDFTRKAKEDIEFFKKSGNKAVLNKINTLIEEILESPFVGTGKPEPLRYDLSGYWSRRINREHRLTYEVTEEIIIILSLKGHYE